MFLTIASARLPCCAIFSRLPFSVFAKLGYRAPRGKASTFTFANFFVQLIDQLDRKGRKIIDEIERILDLMGDAGGELAEGCELFGLDQAILRGAKFVERF